MRLALLSDLIIDASEWQVFGLSVLAILHATWVSWNFRKSHPTFTLKPLEALVATWVLSFGGGSITGLPWTWLGGNKTLPIYTLVPLAIYYGPGDVLYRILQSMSVILAPPLIMADCMSKTLAICRAGVDAVRYHPSGNATLKHSFVAAIFCGTMAGCGSGVLGSALGLERDTWKFATPKMLKNPGRFVILPFLGALLYFLLTDATLLPSMAKTFFGIRSPYPHPLSRPTDAIALIMALLLTCDLVFYLSTSQASVIKKSVLNQPQRAKAAKSD